MSTTGCNQSFKNYRSLSRRLSSHLHEVTGQSVESRTALSAPNGIFNAKHFSDVEHHQLQRIRFFFVVVISKKSSTVDQDIKSCRSWADDIKLFGLSLGVFIFDVKQDVIKINPVRFTLQNDFCLTPKISRLEEVAGIESSLCS